MIYLKLTSNVQVRMIDVKSRVTKLVIEKTREIILEQLPNRLENDLNELICEFVEDGVNSYYNEQLNQTLENISKKHQIPLELLLRDIPQINGGDRCRGKNGGEMEVGKSGVLSRLVKMDTVNITNIKVKRCNRDVYLVYNYTTMDLKKCSFVGVRVVNKKDL